MNKAKFITFEGVDGAGKSTHLEWFSTALRQRGLDILVTREPGGTPLGEQLREILLKHPMHPETETLLNQRHVSFRDRVQPAGAIVSERREAHQLPLRAWRHRADFRQRAKRGLKQNAPDVSH